MKVRRRTKKRKRKYMYIFSHLHLQLPARQAESHLFIYLSIYLSINQSIKLYMPMPFDLSIPPITAILSLLHSSSIKYPLVHHLSFPSSFPFPTLHTPWPLSPYPHIHPIPSPINPFHSIPFQLPTSDPTIPSVPPPIQIIKKVLLHIPYPAQPIPKPNPAQQETPYKKGVHTTPLPPTRKNQNRHFFLSFLYEPNRVKMLKSNLKKKKKV
jgi:hypothetical protein